MKKKSQKNQEDEYTNIQIKECETKRVEKRKPKAIFPSNGKIHRKGYYQPR